MANSLTKKECSLLEDLKKDEQLCIDKYGEYEAQAIDPGLQNLFNSIKQTETEHLDTVNSIINGTVPSMTGKSKEKKKPEPNKTIARGADKEHDKYLCSDALHTEKQISGTYNMSIFEFACPEIRQALNHIQKEEQEHGKVIFDYMSCNNMYN